jgi:predicted PurR-regulated permease PerM
MNSASALIGRHWRLLAFVLGLFLVFWLLWALRSVLMPFTVGFILAYMLLPIIRWVEKRLPGAGKKPQLKRISIILVIYLLSLAVMGLTVFYIVTVMGRSLMAMAEDSPQLIPNGLNAITHWLKSFPVLSSPSAQQQIDVYSAQAGVALGHAIRDLLTRGVGLIQSSSGMVLGFVAMPVFLFFILKDWDKLRDSLQSALPAWALTHVRCIFSIIQNVTGRYVRGQLLLGLAVGLGVLILLMILRIDFALPLAVFAGITEMVPLIGPWLGGIAGILVTLAVAPEKVVWVALGYLIIQLLENNLLVPKIQGSQMNINPAFIIVLSILGAYFAGILGFIIALPLTMTVVEIFKYLKKSTRDGTIS